MNFIPEPPKEIQEVPYYEDVSATDGWQGQSTGKAIDRLKAEVTESLHRLGAIVRGFQQGQFLTGGKKRDGFRVSYYIAHPNGPLAPGQIDIAALPLRSFSDRKREASLRMALYMLRVSLDGAWLLQQLAPGYAPLMPWLLVDGERTISQIWAESDTMRNLLPPGSSDFDVVEGEYTEE